MILVICMAGFNTRFHDAGFDLPKYLLPWENSVILAGILRQLGAQANFSRVVLLPNQRDRYFKAELLEAAAPFGVRDEDVIYIPDTRGQAHTAALGAQVVVDSRHGADEPIAFHNADTVLVGRDWPWVGGQLRTRDVFVDVFPASSSAYSYVALHEGRVTRIKEKLVISPFASSGFYAFRSADYYLDAFEAHAGKTAAETRETYISDVIQTLVEGGADVFINELNRDATTIVLGKPEEYGLELARRALMR